MPDPTPTTAAQRRAAAEAKIAAAKAAEAALEQELASIKDDAETAAGNVLDTASGLEAKFETVAAEGLKAIKTTFATEVAAVKALEPAAFNRLANAGRAIEANVRFDAGRIVDRDGANVTVESVTGAAVPGSAGSAGATGLVGNIGPTGSPFPIAPTTPVNQPPGSPLVRGGSIPPVTSGSTPGSDLTKLFTVAKDALGTLSVEVHHQDAGRDLTKAIAWLITESAKLTGNAQLTLESVTAHLRRTSTGKIDASQKPTASPTE